MAFFNCNTEADTRQNHALQTIQCTKSLMQLYSINTLHDGLLIIYHIQIGTEAVTVGPW